MPNGNYSGRNYCHSYYQDDGAADLTAAPEPEVGWHVLWTRSNFEKPVMEQLLTKNYEVFLPLINQWSSHGKAASASLVVKVPMFKGYLFLRHKIDKAAYLDISNTKGLVNILGVRWNRLARIPDEEIQSIKLVVDSQLPTLPYPYLKAGAEVRITRGTLANARGILVRSDLSKGLFVISVRLLHRSVAVKINCADVVPV